MIQELPREFELVGKVFGQGFDSESFGRVMAAIENVDPKFFRDGVSPVWSLTGDEGINALLDGGFQFAACTTCDNADALAGGRAARDEMRDGTGNML